MEQAISAAGAYRRFSELLRTVQKGQSVVTTSHGRSVARITPFGGDDRAAEGAPLRALRPPERERVVETSQLPAVWRDYPT